MTQLQNSAVSLDGPTVVVFHGGPGPRSVKNVADHLGPGFSVFLPTHPGWNGTPRDDSTHSASDLASQYLDEMERLGLTEVTVIGSSFGGWVAAEVAVQDAQRPQHRVVKLVLIDALGVDVAGVTVPPFEFSVPEGLSPEQHTAMASMKDSLDAYLSTGMTDPDLTVKASTLELPVTVIWGAEDDVVSVEYGRQVAQIFPDATFIEIPNAGHAPQLAQPDATFAAIDTALGVSK